MSRISELIDGGLVQTTDRIPALRTGAVVQVKVGDVVTQDSSAMDITGGKINATVIGGLTAADGSFVNLDATGGTSLTDLIVGGDAWIDGATTLSGAVSIDGTALSGADLTINRGNNTETVIALTDESSGFHHGLILKGNDSFLLGRSSSNTAAGMEPFMSATLSTLGVQFAGNLGVTGATTLSNDLTINKTGNGFFSINGTDAAFIRLQDSGGSTNQKYVDFVTDNGSFDIRLLNDDTSVKSIPIAIAPTGGIGVAGDVTVTGGALSVSHNNSATVPADVFGGMMTFNHTAGGGEVDFFNQYTSAGTGGFDFYQVTAGGSAANLLARLDKSGNATFAGNLGTSEGQITASNGDPLENVAVFTATNASYTGGALQVITTRAADATAFDLAKFNTSGGSTTNCRIRGDGDLENVNNAYTGISDIKLKQDIFLAGSQTEDIKAIAKIVSKYRLKDQVAHDENAHFHLGVIAQELELISAGLVGESEDSDYVEVSPAKAEVKELQPMTWQKPVMEIVQVVVLDEEGNPTDETETKEQQVHLDEETDVAESIVDGVLIAAHKAIVSKPQFTIENVVDSNGEIVMREVITQKAEPAKMDFVKNGEFTKHVKYSILYMKCVKALGELIERVEALEAK